MVRPLRIVMVIAALVALLVGGVAIHAQGGPGGGRRGAGGFGPGGPGAGLPLKVPTDRVANAILQLQPGGETEITWEEKKKK